MTAALTMSTVLALFADNVVDGTFKAPQANLIRLVIDGVVDGGLPWGLVLVGAFMAFCVEIMGLPTLAFAVGLYLPIHLATPIMLGGLVRLAIEKGSRKEERAHRREVGVLFASGLIAGAALVGVFAAALTFFELGWFSGAEASPEAWLPATLAFGGLTAVLAWVALGRPGRPT